MFKLITFQMTTFETQMDLENEKNYSNDVDCHCQTIHMHYNTVLDRQTEKIWAWQVGNFTLHFRLKYILSPHGGHRTHKISHTSQTYAYLISYSTPLVVRKGLHKPWEDNEDASSQSLLFSCILLGRLARSARRPIVFVIILIIIRALC